MLVSVAGCCAVRGGRWRVRWSARACVIVWACGLSVVVVVVCIGVGVSVRVLFGGCERLWVRACVRARV